MWQSLLKLPIANTKKGEKQIGLIVLFSTRKTHFTSDKLTFEITIIDRRIRQGNCNDITLQLLKNGQNERTAA